MGNLVELLHNFVGFPPAEFAGLEYIVAVLIFLYVLGFVFDLITLFFPKKWR